MPSDRQISSTMDRSSSQGDPSVRLRRLMSCFQNWSNDWGLSRLPRDVDVQFSDNLGPVLGRCDTRSGKIWLNGVLLLAENESLLHETLCHEAAHIIAALRYGTGIEEHGIEWQEYMEKAGFIPRPVIGEGKIVGLNKG
ncbi:MAG TPA: SprT-like domain-containing protein [Roseimicrobium sp.]|nr:SprT-like domain-containing protein [Roseimicrobium sp.]